MNMGLIGMKGLILVSALLLGGCSGEVVNTFSTKEVATITKWEPSDRHISFITESGLVMTNVYIMKSCVGCYSRIGDKMEVVITHQVRSNNVVVLDINSNDLGSKMRK